MRQQGVDTDFIWRFSLPTDFGERYRGAFVASEHVRVYLHATALQFRMAPNREAVDRLEIAALPGKKFVVKARHYIMATGGLEAARLLMLSKDAGSEGLGNSRGLVGRFYISHITGDLGSAVFSPEFATAMASYEQTRDGVYCRRALSISEETQRKERLLNIRVILSHPSPADPAHGSGVLSAMYLVKSHFSDRIPPEYSKALSGMSTYEELSAHCRNIVRDWRNVAGFGNLWIRRRILSKRKLPSVVHRSRSNVYTLHFDAEQAPNPESRVTLSESKDEYGLNRLKVDWRCTAQDIESVVKCAAFISHALESSGVGKCLFDAQKLGPVIAANTGVGSHHVGLTRMADSPSAGVVDSNCKVHGIDNLFVASSATFPTASFANPTLTIVALAIRLADHLKTRTARPVEVLADAS
jgi:choline dehydrogenase-like flavoprotein